MLSLKNLTLMILMTGSSTAFCGSMGPVCIPEEATAGCQMNSWKVGAEALYLKPAYNGASSIFNYLRGSFDNDVYVSHTLRQAWHWGFKVEAAYHFNTGNDLNANWSHWQETNREQLLDTYFFGNTDNPNDRTTTLRIKPKWDALNLELGQKLYFNNFKHIRFHGGLQYATIQRNSLVDLSVIVRNSGEVGSASSSNFKLSLNGIGPRLGTDMGYEWAHGFGFYANGAIALLVGENKFRRLNTHTDEPTENSLGGSRVMVPVIDGKVGISYRYSMPAANLTLNAGYMVVDYFNALGTSGYTTDFGLQGLTLGFSLIA